MLSKEDREQLEQIVACGAHYPTEIDKYPDCKNCAIIKNGGHTCINNEQSIAQAKEMLEKEKEAMKEFKVGDLVKWNNSKEDSRYGYTLTPNIEFLLTGRDFFKIYKIDDRGVYLQGCEGYIFSTKWLEKVNTCEFTKGQEVEHSSDGKEFDRACKEKFYDYNPKLEKPFLTIDEDGDIANWKYCRAVQPKYEAYHKFNSEWIGKKVVLKTPKDHDSIQTILGTDSPSYDLPDRIYLRNDYNNAINCFSNWNNRLFEIAKWPDSTTFGEPIE